ncbi:acyl carrier protein [Roseospirillum parvum]|uniref:Acyl carrier protein n=1 Tax=Roseospirillum parvum TaxID=83401 RepID=A0A1G7V0I9_9PROT|nr:acyl carrier protein [Roseospirillum parvum]SDG52879.1 acyl carrier protein [Roseospirillum parvum]
MTEDSATLHPTLVATFEKLFGPEVAANLTPDATMDDVEGWDSFSFIELVTALEDALGISFEQDELPDLTKVAAIQAAITRHLS